MPSVSLAVDVHGGDHGPEVVIDGVLAARKMSTTPFTTYLCGKGAVISATLDSLGYAHPSDETGIHVIHCPEVVDASDVPTRVWKNKRNASIVQCVTLQKEGTVKASLSAGDTRILMGASIFLLGRKRGIVRPALAALIPTTGSRPSLLLDVGANLDCRVDQLVTFGMMGYEYVKERMGVLSPSVALLNVGKEETKGTKTIIDAAKILSEKCPGYCGFIEGSRVLAGDVDIIVCDGFTGNILLKACESFHALTESVLQKNRRLINALKNKAAILNAENYGAVPLLGLEGVVFKAHGSSSSKAITQAMLAAIQAVT